eukprot:gene11976-5377_t
MSSTNLVEDELKVSFFSLFNSKTLKISFKEYLQKENIKVPNFLEKPIFITDKETIENLDFYLYHFPKYIRTETAQKLVKEKKKSKTDIFEQVENLRPILFGECINFGLMLFWVQMQTAPKFENWLKNNIDMGLRHAQRYIKLIPLADYGAFLSFIN